MLSLSLSEVFCCWDQICEKKNEESGGGQGRVRFFWLRIIGRSVEGLGLGFGGGRGCEEDKVWDDG